MQDYDFVAGVYLVVKRFKRKYFSCCFIIPLVRSALVTRTIYRISQVQKVFPGDSRLWFRNITFLMAVQTNSAGNAVNRYFSLAFSLGWNRFDFYAVTLISCSTSLMHGSVNMLKCERRGNMVLCVSSVVSYIERSSAVPRMPITCICHWQCAKSLTLC